MNLCFFLFALTLNLFAQTEILTTTVVDEAAVFDSTQKATLENKIQTLKDQGRWLVVNTLSDLGDESIEDYAERKFKHWGIGEKGKDNGLLLVLAMKNRKFRLEVGYGLEGEITDFQAAQILDTYLKPALKDGHPFDGISALIDQLSTEAEATKKAAEDWAKQLKELEAYINLPHMKLTAEDKGAIAQAILRFREVNVFMLLTEHKNCLNSLDPVPGMQRLVIEVGDGQTHITKDPVGFMTDQMVEEMKNTWEQGGHVVLVNYLWRIQSQAREKQSRLKREKAALAYVEARKLSETIPLELYYALSFLVPLVWFFFASYLNRKTVKSVKEISATVSGFGIQSELRRLINYLQFYPAIVMAMIAVIASQVVMLNSPKLPYEQLEFNAMWIVVPIICLGLGLIACAFISVLVTLIFHALFKRKLNLLIVKDPSSGPAIQKIISLLSAQMRSGRSGGGGSSGSW